MTKAKGVDRERKRLGGIVAGALAAGLLSLSPAVAGASGVSVVTCTTSEVCTLPVDADGNFGGGTLGESGEDEYRFYLEGLSLVDASIQVWFTGTTATEGATVEIEFWETGNKSTTNKAEMAYLDVVPDEGEAKAELFLPLQKWAPGDYSLSVAGPSGVGYTGLFMSRVSTEENHGTVPIPAAGWLFGSAMLGFLARKEWRRADKSR